MSNEPNGISDRPNGPDQAGLRDGGWVRDTLAGDLEAFDRLVETYQRQAVSVSYRLLGNKDDALDVVQEAFVRAYKSLGRLKEPERFKAWFMRIVNNLSLNARRSRHSRSAEMTVRLDDHWNDESAGRNTGGTAAKSVGPVQSAEGKELGSALEAAMDQLPEHQRQALTLFSLEGMSQKEIAEIMDTTVQTVKWNVFQARKKLREILGEQLLD